MKQIVSWPMCAANHHMTAMPEIGEYPLGKTGKFAFPTGQGILKPVLHPQFVFLGMNWSSSGEGANLSDKANWANGYCEQAQVVRDSKLRGGYFTDFIKFFTATKFTDNDKKKLYEEKVRLDDNQVLYHSNGKPVRWFEVYVYIFKKELELLTEKFEKPEYIIIWGSTLYKLLDDVSQKVYVYSDDVSGKKLTKGFCELFKDYKVLVFGCHYSKSGNGHTFPIDKTSVDKELLSRRRVYKITGKYEKSPMYGDRNENDQRRYVFALLEDDLGKLRAYNGNPNK